MTELDEALQAGAERVMLDNFSFEAMHEAVAFCRGRAELEASGGFTIDQLAQVGATLSRSHTVSCICPCLFVWAFLAA